MSVYEKKNSAYVGGVEEATDAEVFGATYERASSCRRLDAIQQVTLRLELGNFIRFQPDTGAQCNVLPLDIYKKAMLETSHYRTLDLRGNVILRLWRCDNEYKLDCRLAEMRPFAQY